MRTHIDRAGIYGVVIGFTALAIVLFQFFYGPIQKQQSSFFDTTKKSIQALVSDNTGSTSTSLFSDVNADKVLSYASILFAFLALIAGAIAYIRDDKKEAAYASLSVGAATLFFHFILVAIGVVIILAVLAFILSN